MAISDIDNVRNAILLAQFEPMTPAVQQKLTAAFDSPELALDNVYAELRCAGMSDTQVCRVLDTYTTGNNGIVLLSRPDSEVRHVMMPEATARELQANLRTRTAKKLGPLGDHAGSKSFEL